MYNLNVMRESACLVFNPIMVDNYAAFFNCTPAGPASGSMMSLRKAIYLSWFGAELLVCCLCCLFLMYAFELFYLSSGNCVATYWEKAAHSAYNMFLVYVADCQFSSFPFLCKHLNITSGLTC